MVPILKKMPRSSSPSYSSPWILAKGEKIVARGKLGFTAHVPTVHCLKFSRRYPNFGIDLQTVEY